VWFVVGTISGADADVSPGDVVDKTNWKQAENLLPESLLNWVKKGEWILQVDQLNHDPVEFYAKEVLEAWKPNIGRFDVDAETTIIEAATGGPPEFILGMPFPEIAPEDPNRAVKILHNSQYSRHIEGHLKFETHMHYLARSGLERSGGGNYTTNVYTGYVGARSLANPTGLERTNVLKVTAPYDVAGFAVMLWRYLDARPDVNFSYVPTIRRVRRMSPASRSDALMGSDICLDDTAGYDGKVAVFEWKLLREQDALIPFLSKDSQKLVKDQRFGGWATTSQVPDVTYGYQVKEWQGAPWAPTNLVWVKKKVHVIEMTPKDPYYNYGRQLLWVDAERTIPVYKVIHDRAGAYWKSAVSPLISLENEDQTVRQVAWGALIMVDDRTGHGTISEQVSSRHRWVWRIDPKPDDFTLAGFQKFCK
jgi:hypothetical protein